MDQKTLKTLLRYEPETGEFFWLPKPREEFKSLRAWASWKARFEEAKAGSLLPCGYRYINIDGRPVREHRLAWLYMTGEWPAGPLDHKDRDRTNNKFDNLRMATISENGFNKNSKPSADRVARGVDKRGPRWRARIKKDRRMIHLGHFDTEAEAYLAYARAARELYGEFADNLL